MIKRIAKYFLVVGAVFVTVKMMSGCLPVTPRAAQRRQESGKLRSCLQGASFIFSQSDGLARHQCLMESVDSCRDAGLEADCAVGDLITETNHP